MPFPSGPHRPVVETFVGTAGAVEEGDGDGEGLGVGVGDGVGVGVGIGDDVGRLDELGIGAGTEDDDPGNEPPSHVPNAL